MPVFRQFFYACDRVEREAHAILKLFIRSRSTKLFWQAINVRTGRTTNRSTIPVSSLDSQINMGLAAFASNSQWHWKPVTRVEPAAALFCRRRVSAAHYVQTHAHEIVQLAGPLCDVTTTRSRLMTTIGFYRVCDSLQTWWKEVWFSAQRSRIYCVLRGHRTAD